MGSWGLSTCVFASMQGCHAPKPTHSTNNNNVKKTLFCCGCRMGGYRSMAALNVCIHMFGQSAETNEIFDMGAKVHYGYLSSSLCVGCVCYMIE